MTNSLIKSSDQISEKEIYLHLSVVWKDFSTQWFNLQSYWVDNAYRAFNDIEKYMILVFVVKKTFEFYSKHFKKFTFDQFYNGATVEVENISIIDISKSLKISKETARRKVIELEKSGVLKKNRKKIIIDRNKINFQKPTNAIQYLASFLSNYSDRLFKDKISKFQYKKEDLVNFFKKDFTFLWNIFLDSQIQLSLIIKSLFDDYESFYIYGIIIVNQNLELQKKLKSKNLKIEDNKDYFDKLFHELNRGVNAMSISAVSNIPRATVVRKLVSLKEKGLIDIDEKKLYRAIKFPTSNQKQNEIISLISVFISNIYNQLYFSKVN